VHRKSLVTLAYFPNERVLSSALLMWTRQRNLSPTTRRSEVCAILSQRLRANAKKILMSHCIPQSSGRDDLRRPVIAMHFCKIFFIFGESVRKRNFIKYNINYNKLEHSSEI